MIYLCSNFILIHTNHILRIKRMKYGLRSVGLPVDVYGHRVWFLQLPLAYDQAFVYHARAIWVSYDEGKQNLTRI